MKAVKKTEGSPQEQAAVMLEGLLTGLGDTVFDPSALSEAMRKMSMVVAESDFVGEEVSRAFVSQVAEAFGSEADNEANAYQVQVDAAESQLSEEGFAGEKFSGVLAQYHENGATQDLAFAVLDMIPEEKQTDANPETVGREVYRLIKSINLTGLMDTQTTQEVLSYTMGVLGVIESEIKANQEPVDLENPGAYRQEIAEKIETELIPQYGVLAIRDGSNLVNAMAKSVGYDGEKLIALFERTLNTGDDVANALKDMYLQTKARDYLLAARNEEQVSGFINSL